MEKKIFFLHYYTMIAKLLAASQTDLGSILVNVEVNILPGLPGIHILGLADHSVKECKERIRSAIINSGFQFPVKNIIINLAPNDTPKIGSMAELAICLGILIISHQIPNHYFNNKLILGSLSLDGKINSNTQIMSHALQIYSSPYNNMLVPKSALEGLNQLPKVKIYAIEYLQDILLLINNQLPFVSPKKFIPKRTTCLSDMNQIQGQEKSKKAVAYALIGEHHTLIFGSPGTGKTMLANTIPNIQTNLTLKEALEITAVYAVGNIKHNQLVQERPFRTPHHTSSDIAMVGGGTIITPGEVSLSHRGILFLDELSEFKANALQVIREPLEEKKITISRAKGSFILPAGFTLLGVSNPCKCGYLFSKIKKCTCSYKLRHSFLRKISGPFEDRITIETETNEDEFNIQNHHKPPNSTWWQSKIQESQNRMLYRNNQIANNSLPFSKMIPMFSKIPNYEKSIKHYQNIFFLSHRSLINTLRLSLTIQDFNESATMKLEFIEEAFSYKLFRKLVSEYLRVA